MFATIYGAKLRLLMKINGLILVLVAICLKKRKKGEKKRKRISNLGDGFVFFVLDPPLLSSPLSLISAFSPPLLPLPSHPSKTDV